jgi:hypothetical protein
MGKFLIKAAAFLIVFVGIAAILLGLWWVMWKIWMAVISYFWISAPENIARPGYWYFVGALMIIGFIGKQFRGNRD